MIVITISGPDAVDTARHYVETWRKDGSAVLSPFLGDMGLDQDEWVRQTDDLVELLSPDTAVAVLSDSDEAADLDAARTYGDTLHVRTWRSDWYSDDQMHTAHALKIDAWRRRGRQ
jgi:hypothetical protein